MTTMCVSQVNVMWFIIYLFCLGMAYLLGRDHRQGSEVTIQGDKESMYIWFVLSIVVLGVWAVTIRYMVQPSLPV